MPADADLTEDVPPDGWNSLDGTYAFRYVDPSGTKPPLLVKALSVSATTLGQDPYLLQYFLCQVTCRSCVPELMHAIRVQGRMSTRLALPYYSTPRVISGRRLWAGRRQAAGALDGGGARGRRR